MKTRPQFWPIFTLLSLFLILLITACDSGSDTPQTPNTVPPTEEVISNNPDESSDAQPTIALANATVVPQNTETPEQYPTAETAPQPTETVDSSESVDSSDSSESVDSSEVVEEAATAEATEAPELIATPEVKAFVTPKARTQWRAGSGELFIRFDNGVKNFQYYLYVPEDWYGIFEMRQDTEDIVSFSYIGNPEMKQEVFRVQAFPEHIWAEKKAAGDKGIEFHTLRNVQFAYYPASENPFEGEDAEAFQSMIDDIPEIISNELEIVSRRFNKE